MTGVNLQSLQELLAFRDALPNLSDAAISEVQELVQSAQGNVDDAAQTLTECREQLWHEEDRLHNTEEPNRSDYSAVESIRKQVAQAEADLSEIQEAYASFQTLSNIIGNRLAVNFENAMCFLDERIEAIIQYQSISLSDHTQSPQDTSSAQAFDTITEAGKHTQTDGNNVEVSSLQAAAASELPRLPNGEVSPLQTAAAAELPKLPNGMKWIEIDKIQWDGVDGVPDNLEFKRVSKDDMKEMLETFERKLLPILSENEDISFDDLITIDRENASAGTSSSLMLCHDSLIGSSQASDVIVLHSRPAANSGTDHPAADKPAFESGRRARLEGIDQNRNPYRGQLGREGAANIWDQGWKYQSSERELAFTSGRHRTLVARELGWKYIPARVIGGD